MGRHRLVAAGLLVVIIASPPARSAIKGALVVPEVIPSPVHPLSWLTPGPTRTPVALPDGPADLYRPRGLAAAPAWVLVHGANPGGKDDPRVVELARALARDGRRVVVPQLGLRDQRLDPTDLLRIREAIQRVAGPHNRVGILAFSYGAGLALVALAGEPALQHRVAFVATVGAYYSLLDLLQGATTGTVPFQGHTVVWHADPQAPGIAAEQLGTFLGGADGAALARAWRIRNPAGLAPAPESVYLLLANRDPSRFPALASALPPGLLDKLTALSPAQVIGQIVVPVFALHSRTDPASPPTESRLLVSALQPRVPTRLVLVGNLSHVTPVATLTGDIADAYRVAAFAGTALRAQEGWPRP